MVSRTVDDLFVGLGLQRFEELLELMVQLLVRPRSNTDLLLLHHKIRR